VRQLRQFRQSYAHAFFIRVMVGSRRPCRIASEMSSWLSCRLTTSPTTAADESCGSVEGRTIFYSVSSLKGRSLVGTMFTPFSTIEAGTCGRTVACSFRYVLARSAARISPGASLRWLESMLSKSLPAHNQQLQRTVLRRCGRGACAPFHYAHALGFTRQRAAAELRRYTP
jgi:hypothetical protein